jgi:radical SAM protein with 4Fe4S-binding SPASM domain
MPVYPLKLTIGVTNRCNMRCRICNVWRMYEEEPEKARLEMSLGDYRRLFSSLDNGRLLYLEFTGGEPFLREDIGDILVSAAEEVGSLRLCAVTTNGSLPGLVSSRVADVLRRLPAGVGLTVGVSIDGVAEAHDSLRGRRGAYADAVETYRSLRGISQRDPRLTPHVSYTISGGNAGGFEEFYRGLHEETGASIMSVSVSFEQEGHLYNVSSRQGSQLGGASRDIAFYLKELSGVCGGSSVVDHFRRAFYGHYVGGIQPFLDGRWAYSCAALTLSAYIDAYGDMYPCVVWGEKIGNVRESGFEGLWFSNARKELLRRVRCGGCPGCWTPCEAQPSMLLDPVGSVAAVLRAR